MFSSKLVRRTSRELVRELRRHISKTSSVPNSEAISRQQENKLNTNDNQQSSATNKWLTLNRHNNIRALSTIQTKTKPKAIATAMVSKEEARDFMAMFPDIVRDLTDAGRHTDIPEVTKRFAKVLQYNVPNGKKNRGLSVVAAYKILEQNENLTPENVRLANLLGWCVEMLQAFLLVMDDVMDQSETRRGVPCWYKKDNVGLSAINDACLLENGIYSILRKYFSSHPSYIPVIELFHDITLKTSMGQCLDSMSHKDGKPNLEMFTMNRYNSIVKYKTAYYTFQLPIALAMHLANLNDPEMHRQAKTILLEMGQFFQIQDDFLDCFGDPKLTGKQGTDIREGKCTWLAVVALQRASPAQRQIMEEHYGQSNPESIEKIRCLYEELSLPNTYAVYEEESFNIIRTHIQQISKGLPHNLFFKLVEKIYKREC
ncbi:farnesyl pyrophosphate synthase isoform X1 [Aethina tumida]|uniref:farnesyl pyrophosphate synthase isoform X1 n=1 Tax=Aethina tumida TaxID=116153 RepID=UPI00096B218B|nr:farnesyl pyrophosphate synthase isoform X1 [Aethina tumida]